MKNASHRLAKLTTYSINGKIAILDTGMQQDSQNGITFQTDFLNHQIGCLETQQHGIQPKHITTDMILLNITRQIMAHFLLVVICKRRSDSLLDAIIQREDLFFFL